MRHALMIKMLFFSCPIVVLCFCNIKSGNSEANTHQPTFKRIDTVFVNYPRQDTVYFKIDEKLDVLTSSKDSVWWISQITKNHQWVMLNRMPANPEDAYGQNERYDIYFIPTKKSVTREELGFKPIYSFLSLFEKNNLVFVTLDSGENIDTVNLTAYAIKNNYWLK
ncbi:MAG: hypothetical protein JW768_03070 [Chitinispirillaceae bacterium]|nr:hypothetical protein [Chitinispirillaceae bacterium]